MSGSVLVEMYSFVASSMNSYSVMLLSWREVHLPSFGALHY